MISVRNLKNGYAERRFQEKVGDLPFHSKFPSQRHQILPSTWGLSSPGAGGRHTWESHVTSSIRLLTGASHQECGGKSVASLKPPVSAHRSEFLLPRALCGQPGSSVPRLSLQMADQGTPPRIKEPDLFVRLAWDGKLERERRK